MDFRVKLVAWLVRGWIKQACQLGGWKRRSIILNSNLSELEVLQMLARLSSLERKLRVLLAFEKFAKERKCRHFIFIFILILNPSLGLEIKTSHMIVIVNLLAFTSSLAFVLRFSLKMRLRLKVGPRRARFRFILSALFPNSEFSPPESVLAVE